MSEEDTNTCAICWDDFLEPKILNCRHTFCKPCLKGYLKKAQNRAEITCPLCRQTQELGDGGLDDLRDNYFVKLRPPEEPEKLCCSICFEEAEVRSCSHCLQKLCPGCRASHKLALKISGESYEHDSDSDSDALEDLDDNDITDESPPPFHLMMCDQFIKTTFHTRLVSSFQVTSLAADSESDGHPPICCIHRSEGGRCLVLLAHGVEVIEYNIDGTEINRSLIREGMRSIVITPDDRLIFSVVREGVILETHKKSSGLRLFSHSRDYQPSSLSCFSDCRVASVGASYKRHSETGKGTERAGALLIYDKTGKMIKEIVDGSYGPLFKNPVCVSVNKFNNTICVADEGQRCVLIFSEIGSVISRYEGTDAQRHRGLFPFRLNSFLPLTLCHDSEGNVIIGSVEDGSLHVLTGDGNFVGYILTKDSMGFGHPSSLCVDHENNIWIGDYNDGKIRIYNISSYRNSFSEIGNDFSRFLQQRRFPHF